MDPLSELASAATASGSVKSSNRTVPDVISFDVGSVSITVALAMGRTLQSSVLATTQVINEVSHFLKFDDALLGMGSQYTNPSNGRRVPNILMLEQIANKQDKLVLKAIGDKVPVAFRTEEPASRAALEATFTFAERGTITALHEGRLLMADKIKTPLYDLLAEFESDDAYGVTDEMADKLLNAELTLAVAGSSKKVQRKAYAVWAAIFRFALPAAAEVLDKMHMARTPRSEIVINVCVPAEPLARFRSLLECFFKKVFEHADVTQKGFIAGKIVLTCESANAARLHLLTSPGMPEPQTIACTLDTGGGTIDLSGMEVSVVGGTYTMVPAFGDRGKRTGAIDIDDAILERIVIPILRKLEDDVTLKALPDSKLKNLVAGTIAGAGGGGSAAAHGGAYFDEQQFKASGAYSSFVADRDMWKAGFNGDGYAAQLHVKAFTDFVQEVVPTLPPKDASEIVRRALTAVGKSLAIDGIGDQIVVKAESTGIAHVMGGVLHDCWRAVEEAATGLVGSVLKTMKRNLNGKVVNMIVQVGGPSGNEWYRGRVLDAARAVFPGIRDMVRNDVLRAGETTAVLGGIVHVWAQPPSRPSPKSAAIIIDWDLGSSGDSQDSIDKFINQLEACGCTESNLFDALRAAAKEAATASASDVPCITIAIPVLRQGESVNPITGISSELKIRNLGGPRSKLYITVMTFPDAFKIITPDYVDRSTGGLRISERYIIGDPPAKKTSRWFMSDEPQLDVEFDNLVIENVGAWEWFTPRLIVGRDGLELHITTNTGAIASCRIGEHGAAIARAAGGGGTSAEAPLRGRTAAGRGGAVTGRAALPGGRSSRRQATTSSEDDEPGASAARGPGRGGARRAPAAGQKRSRAASSNAGVTESKGAESDSDD